MSKSKTEKKLLKNAHKFAALEAELQLIFPPKVFIAIEELALAHLKDNKFDTVSRERVSKLAFALRQETYVRFGHESLETIALAKLLRYTVRGFQAKPPRLDSISHIQAYHRDRRLNTSQEGAAEMIKKIWEAFGKFRFIGARGMEGGGGGGGQNLQPLDVMGHDVWEHYKKVYIPWYRRAAFISVNRKRYSPGAISLAAVSFRILVEDYFPEELDHGYGLVAGTSFRALKVALTAYYEPEAFEEFLGTSASAKDTRQDVWAPAEPSQPTPKA